MKKQKSLLIIFILLTFIIILSLPQTVFANNTTNLFRNKEYSEDFKQWSNLSQEEKNKTIMPPIYNIEPTSNTSENIIYKARLLGASINPRYSLKDVIPDNVKIRNQGQTSMCWAIASLSSLETNLALYDYKQGINTSKVYDYSERHMAYANTRIFANNVQNPIGYNKDIKERTELGKWQCHI